MEWSWRLAEEQAKEELQSLETQHPNHFDYLKAELKSFILLLQSEHPNLPSSDQKSISKPSFSSATTQASSSKKRKGPKGGSKQQNLLKSRANASKRSKKQRRQKRDDTTSVDAVLERARVCLKKIQEIKSGLLF